MTYWGGVTKGKFEQLERARVAVVFRILGRTAVCIKKSGEGSGRKSKAFPVVTTVPENVNVLTTSYIDSTELIVLSLSGHGHGTEPPRTLRLNN
ncbi:hypothetical protein D3C73_269480 [compost metagenome]